MTPAEGESGVRVGDVEYRGFPVRAAAASEADAVGGRIAGNQVGLTPSTAPVARALRTGATIAFPATCLHGSTENVFDLPVDAS